MASDLVRSRIPICNSESNLEETLSSILNQTAKCQAVERSRINTSDNFSHAALEFRPVNCLDVQSHTANDSYGQKSAE
jgi:hypothetical protein